MSGSASAPEKISSEREASERKAEQYSRNRAQVEAYFLPLRRLLESIPDHEKDPSVSIGTLLTRHMSQGHVPGIIALPSGLISTTTTASSTSSSSLDPYDRLQAILRQYDADAVKSFSDSEGGYASLKASLPTRSRDGRSFMTRLALRQLLWQLLPSLQSMLDETSSLQDKPSVGEIKIIATLLCCAVLLVVPYTDEREKSVEVPFQRDVKKISQALRSSGQLTGAASMGDFSSTNILKSKKELFGHVEESLRGLCEDRQGQKAAIPSAGMDELVSLMIRSISEPSQASSSPRGPLALLTLSSERNLNLSQNGELSRSLKSLIDVPSLVEFLSHRPLHEIARHNPNTAVEVLFLLCQATLKDGKGPVSECLIISLLSDLGEGLDLCDARCFSFCLGLVHSDQPLQYEHHDGWSGRVPLAFMVYWQTLPLYLSRHMSQTMSRDSQYRSAEQARHFEMAMTEWEQRQYARSRGQIRGESDPRPTEEDFSTKERLQETVDDLDKIIGLIKRTQLLELLAANVERKQSTLRSTLLRRGASHLASGLFYPLPESMEESFWETIEAVGVEMKAFALELVRYRRAGELLKRLM